MTWKTDKIANGYLPAYLQIALRLGQDARVLELGVDNSHSLEMWRDLFPDGEIVGVDNRQAALDSVIHSGLTAACLLGEQDDPKLPQRIINATDLDEFDLIVDDASHLANLTRTSLVNLWPLLASGGFYVIEDWGVGFPRAAPIYDPRMLVFVQSLVEQFNPSLAAESVYLDEVARITFEPGLVILQKKHRRDP